MDSKPSDTSADAAVGELFQRWRAGDASADDLLTPTLYGELRHLAGGYLRREKVGHTLQPTALVNEALIRLFGSQPKANERSHLVALAARTMRQVLVDHARRKAANKRLSPEDRVSLETGDVVSTAPSIDLLALDEALTQLAKVSPRAAKVVEIRYFGGLSNQETADALETSLSSVERDWRSARAWLRKALKSEQD